MKPLHIVIGALAAIALAGGGFAAGMTVARGTTGEAAASASPTGAAGRGALGGAGAGRVGQGGAAGAAGGQAVAGRILSVNDGSITVEVRQPGVAGASPTVTSQIVLDREHHAAREDGRDRDQAQRPEGERSGHDRRHHGRERERLGDRDRRRRERAAGCSGWRRGRTRRESERATLVSSERKRTSLSRCLNDLCAHSAGAPLTTTH